MFKPKQVAPFFSMTPIKFTEVLHDVNMAYPLSQTPMGSYLLTEDDFPYIETYIKILSLFKNKKIARVHLKEYVETKLEKEKEDIPEWIHLIKS